MLKFEFYFERSPPLPPSCQRGRSSLRWNTAGNTAAPFPAAPGPESCMNQTLNPSATDGMCRSTKRASIWIKLCLLTTQLLCLAECTVWHGKLRRDSYRIPKLCAVFDLKLQSIIDKIDFDWQGSMGLVFRTWPPLFSSSSTVISADVPFSLTVECRPCQKK